MNNESTQGVKRRTIVSSTKGLKRTTIVDTVFGDITVSSVKGLVYGVYVNETCLFFPSILTSIKGYESEVVGTYADHVIIVDTLRSAMPR